MEGIKLIDASEVEVKKKTSKVEIKKVSKSPMKIIAESDQQNIVESAVKRDVKSSDKNNAKNSDEHRNKLPQYTVSRVIRAIKLKQDIYYGPKNVNKNKFMRMYKKLGLTWTENISIDGVMVDGWFNKDRSQYIIKLLEDGDFKRFKFYGCDDIYDYFIDLGATTFDHNKENSISPNYKNNRVNNANIRDTETGVSGTNISNGIDRNGGFMGADLWSGYRTRQLLKNMSDNWGVKWK